MSTNWNHRGRTPAARSVARLRAGAEATPLRRRVDAVLLLLALIATLAITGLWAGGVALSDRSGLLDPPVVQPLADERLLRNVRDELAARPLRDAVFHAPERQVYLAQEGGVIHTYDPATQLWQTERPFVDADLITTELALLRSGCGRAPDAARSDPCADPDSIWAMSEGGGLLRHTDGAWNVVIGDVAWRGRSGEPVQSASVTTAATSDDGRWLLLGTNGEGLGLYDNAQGAWTAQARIGDDESNPPTVTGAVWWRDRFWVGGPDGLTTVLPDASAPSIASVEARSGAILDLDVGPEGLYILERHPCDEGGGACLWLGRLEQPDAEPVVLLDEQAVYGELDRESLIFAQQWGRRLAVAGATGIYTYDLDLHRWDRRFDQEVTVALALPDDTGFYFAHPGGAGLITPAGDTRSWTLAGDRIIRLLFGRDMGEVLALTGNGNLLALGAGDTPAVLYQAGATTLDPARFATAADLGTLVLLHGPEGVLLHSPTARTYTDIPAASLPDWLQQEGLQALRGGDQLFFLDQEPPQLQIYAAAARDFANPVLYTDTLRTLTPITVSGPARATWDWQSLGLGLIDAEGSVYAVGPGGLARHTGEPRTSLDRETILDVTDQGDKLVVATDAGVRYYSGTERGWVAGPDPGQRIEELGVLGGELLGRGEQGELIAILDPAQPRIGGPDGSQIADADLSDTRQIGGDLFLAGAGVVERYSRDGRRITQRWRLAGSGSVRLRGLIDSQPLAQLGDQAFLGEQPINPAAGPVLALGADANTIWTTRSAEGGPYLKGYPIGGGFSGGRCFFRTPATPAGTQVLDARRLPDGTVAASTDAGLMFYAPQHRSWYPAAGGFGGAGARLYLLGDHLGVAEPLAAPTQLTLIPLDTLRLPDSCAAGSIAISAQPTAVLAAAFDERTGRVAWITPEGAVAEWRGGTTTGLLAAPAGPNGADLHRVYQRSDYLLFTADNRLWRYQLAEHRWEPIDLRFSDGVTQTLDLNVEGGNGPQTVTARTPGDRWYVGQFTASETSVTLSPALAPPARTFGATADELLDVAEGDGTWIFLLRDRIKYFDPAQRTWADDVSLGSADGGRLLRRALGRLVAVGNGGKSWWVAADAGPRPATFARFDLPANEQLAIDRDGLVWRLDGNGIVRRCAPDAATYRCELHNVPPMALAAAEVRRAFSWDGLTIFDTTAGLRAFDPAAGAEILIAGAGRVAGPAVARVFNGRLLLHDGATLLALDRAGQELTALRWDGVSALAADVDGVAWARFGAEWRRASGDDWAAPASSDGRNPAELRLFLSEGGTTVGVAPDRTLYRWEDRLRPQPFPLPAGLDPRTVDFAVAGPGDSWWVRDGARLTHLTEGTCAPPTPTPAPATPTPVTPTAPPATTTSATTTPSAQAGTGTPVSSATPRASATPAPSATPLPTATPRPTACLARSGQVDLPAAFRAPALPAAAEPAVGGLTLTLASGERASITTGATGGAYQITTTAGVAPVLGLADDWPRLRTFLKPLASGGTAFDPVTGLILGQTGGALLAARPSTSDPLSAQAVLQPGPTAPLDVGWLRWERAGGSFVLGGRTLRKEEFIVGDALIAESVGAVLAEAPDRVHMANQHGVWSFAQPEGRLDDPGVSFTPVRLTGIAAAAHGRFLVAGGDLTPGASAIQPAQVSERVTLGDVELTEQVRARGVGATLKRGGATLQVLTEVGFRFDRGRVGVAYAGDQLLLQSDAGIHPARAFGPFDPGPPGAAPGRLTGEPAGPPLYNAAGSWYERAAAGWRALPADPAQTRTLLSDASWSWGLLGGRLEIALAQGRAPSFALGPSGAGLGFTADQLRAAISHEGTLFVLSAAFAELARSPDELGTLAAPRLPPLAADRLESLTAPDGSQALFRFSGQAVSRWDAAARQFAPVPAADNPDAVWPLVDDPRLRFTRRGAQVTKELRLDTLAGGDRWVGFDFDAGRFPFDVVRAFEVVDDRLFVASAAGLQQYAAGPAYGLDRIDKVYDLSSAGGGLASVDRLGRPRADPDLLIAQGGVCVELRASGAPQPCADPALLDTRLRISNDLWEWTADVGGALSGVYYGRGGSPALPVQVVDGRFPHDRLRNVGLCGAAAYAIWEDGWITVYPDTSLTLRQGLAHDALASFAPTQLLCLERDLRLAGGTAAAGMYTLNDEGIVRRFTGAAWDIVGDTAVVNALRERLALPPLVERAAMRLLPSADDAGLVFEQQSLAGDWRPLPWDGDRVGVDRWREVVAVGDQLWAATPTGIVRFERQPDSTAWLDPDSVLVVREPGDEAEPCAISDLERAGERVLARCDSSSERVFAGVLDGVRDAGVFSPLSGADPFAERVLVDAGESELWAWNLTGRRDGDPGEVTITRVRADVPEPVQLVGGRFDFDTIDSLALFYDEGVEVASRGGWFRVPRASFAADAWERPPTLTPAPAEVRTVAVARFGQERFLCLATPEKTMRLALDGTGAAGRCAEFLGADDLWRYERERGEGNVGGPVAAPGQGGEGERRLVDGRFTDDIATGLPLAIPDGERAAYLLPTAAGVLRLDATLAKRAINADFGQLPEGVAPTALYLWGADQPAYLADGTLRSLDGGEELAALPLDLPDGARIEAIEDGHGDLLLVKWMAEGRRGWSVFARGAGMAVGRNRLVVDLRGIDRYAQRQVAWGVRPPFLEVEIAPAQATMLWGPGLSAEPFPYPAELAPVAAIVYEERVLLFGRHELYELNVAPALLRFGSGG